MASSLLMLAVAALVGAAAWRLISNRTESTAAPKSTPAATVAKVVKEESLGTVTLTEEAETRLGIKVEPVARKSIRRVRFYGGEAMIPVGSAIVVSAPLAGMVNAMPSGMTPIGRPVKRGETIVLLAPLLTPESRATLAASMVDAEGQENNAKAQLEAATIARDRAQRLLREDAGSRRNVDEAQAAYDVAAKTFEAATARRAVLSRVAGEMTNGTAAPLPVESPKDGILRNLSAMPGQTVPSGGALFEVADLRTLWVRVPTPAGDLEEISRNEPADVGLLLAAPSTKPRPAKPVVAPPTANPLTGTVDLYYELSNQDGAISPGQRLGVNLPLQGQANSLAIGAGAIVYDIHGGSWMYERVSPRTYVRRRAVVDRMTDGQAVLAAGGIEGTPVVVEGALELFAAETGYVK